MTVHYVTDDWQLQNYVLETKEMPESHTAENLAKHIKSAQSEWGFSDPIGVSDNAAAEAKAFRILQWERVSCFGHNINLAVKAALIRNRKLQKF